MQHRMDTEVPFRVFMALVFGFEAVAIMEGVLADLRKRDRRIYTLSCYCWKWWGLIPVILIGLALHLIIKPKNAPVIVRPIIVVKRNGRIDECISAA